MNDYDRELDPIERRLEDFFANERAQAGSPSGLWERVSRELATVEAPVASQPRRRIRPLGWLGALGGLIAHRKGDFALAAALLVGIGIGLLLVFALPSDIGPEPHRPSAPSFLGTKMELGLTLEASDENALGVAPESHFVLTSRRPLSTEQVSAALHVQPEVEVRLDAVSPTEFHVVPLAPLEENRVYHIAYRPEETGGLEASWAFQVRSPLRVVGSLPADEVAFVPLDSGIEITFSHDGVESPEDYFEISPPVEGRFEQHKRTLVFVPRELEHNTVYTVRMRAGVGVAGSDLALENDHIFQFETGASLRGGAAGQAAQQRVDFLHRVSEAGTSEAPMVSVVTGDTSLRSLPIEVFAYPTLDLFIEDLEARETIPVWAVNTRARSLVDTGRLQPVTSFDAEIEGLDSQPQGLPGFFGQPRLFFRMPGALPTGLYLLQATHRDQVVQAWLQITDIATYLALSDTATLVWANDVSTGLPLQGARVEVLNGDELATTDAEGIAYFDTPDALIKDAATEYGGTRQFGLSFVRISDDQGRQAIVPLSPVLPPSMMMGRCGAFTDFASGWGSSDYWTFTSTDRPLYQPDDTVRFWGIARPRDEAPGQELRGVLTGFSYYAYQPREIGAPITVRTSDLGTFESEITLEGAEAGYYTLSFYRGEEYVTGVSFQVENYVKPAYSISVKPERPAYFPGEEVNVDVVATFFDGTPVPGLALNYTPGTEDGAPPLVTDSAGRGRFSFTARQAGHSDGYYADSQPIWVSPVLPEEADMAVESGIALLGSELAVRAETSYQDGAITVTGTVHRVDPALYSVDAYSAFVNRSLPPHLVETVAGRTITLNVSQDRYEAIEMGQQYDYINKVTQTLYRYEYRPGPVLDTSVTTDADGRFSFSFPADEQASYNIMAGAQDDAGRRSETRAYFSGMWSFSTGLTPYLAMENDPANVFFSRGQFELGDPFGVEMRRGDDVLPSGDEHRYLFYEGQRGIRHYEVQDSPVYRATFSERHVPSATIGGVYFNGFTYIEAQYGPTLQFNPEERRLSIEITSAETSYAPGDDATVEVRVRDAEGNPVEAEVNLAAVDEAFFAVADFYGYQANILGALYAQVPSGIIRTYASHQYPPQLLEPGGRGGDGQARQEFSDVAMYRTVRTGPDGRASVTFKTPDNLTTWRVSAYAVTGDLYAGSGRGDVVVDLPFFVDVSMSDDYLEGDAPVVSVRAYGTALDGDETVEFLLSSPSLGLADPISVTGSPFQRVEIPFPDLTLGEHAVTVEARSGSMTDAVRRTITVLPSRLTVPTTRFYDAIAPGQRLEGARNGSTDVVFMDAGKGQLYPMLQRLRWAYGDRIDQVLARVVASELLAQHFGEEDLPPEVDAMPYIRGANNPDARSGVAVLPYASPDLALTARVAALAPDVFGREVLRSVLQAVASDPDETPERLAIAHFGLASLGDAVLLDVRLLSRHPDLGWRGQIYAALALEALGDHVNATLIYEALIEAYAEDFTSASRLRVGADQDDVLEATALMAGLAAGLGDERAAAFLRYVQENATQNILLYLEELSYASQALQSLGSLPVSFVYTIDGVRQETTLEKGGTLALSLSPSQLDSLRIEVLEGRLSATTLYRTPIASASASQASDDVSIRRTIWVDGEMATTVPESSVVEVRLEVEVGPLAAQSCYQITDLLPSGLVPTTRSVALSLRPMPPPPTGATPPERVIYPYLSDGQRISFCLGPNDPETVVYYARPSGKGTFVWEPATIHNQRYPDVINFSEPDLITVE